MTYAMWTYVCRFNHTNLIIIATLFLIVNVYIFGGTYEPLHVLAQPRMGGFYVCQTSLATASYLRGPGVSLLYSKRMCIPFPVTVVRAR